MGTANVFSNMEREYTTLKLQIQVLGEIRTSCIYKNLLSSSN
jgi:hypothetical protein